MSDPLSNTDREFYEKRKEFAQLDDVELMYELSKIAHGPKHNALKTLLADRQRAREAKLTEHLSNLETQVGEIRLKTSRPEWKSSMFWIGIISAAAAIAAVYYARLSVQGPSRDPTPTHDPATTQSTSGEPAAPVPKAPESKGSPQSTVTPPPPACSTNDHGD